MVHIFEPPLRPLDSSQLLGSRAEHKRKRDLDPCGDHHAQPRQGAANNSDTEDPASSEAEADDQSADSFHAPLRSDVGRARLSPHPRNVKRQHFHVLNTILHRSLLDRDYPRAGQAFACLLRFELAGKRIDLRRKGLWGIGAEILLRTADGRQDVADQDLPDEHAVQTFSQAGFKAARQYYARLILQYPHQRNRPAAISAESFFPAYFSLWIFEVQAQSEHARHALDQHPLDDQPNDSRDIFTETMSVDSSDSDHELRKRLVRQTRIRTTELERARGIADSIRDLTLSPPYDRAAPLLKLQGRVACWMIDLLKHTGTDGELESADLQEMASASFKKAQKYGAKLQEDELQQTVSSSV